jgi:DNA-binding transcriptional regulator LsrR (DeoR family)
MVEQMHPVWKVGDCQVVQIVGGLGDPASEKHANHLVRQLAALARGRAHFLAAPGLMASKDSVDVLAQDPQIRDTVAPVAHRYP